MLKLRNGVKDNQLIILSMAISGPHELNYDYFPRDIHTHVAQ